MMESKDLIKMPIGFMDSGVGGLSVLKEALKVMPNEDFIYYGDSLNAPYGIKQQEEIKALTFNVVDKLVKYGIKGLVVACNTATSAAVADLRKKYPDMPIVGIEPAIKPAVEKSRGGEILVLATPMTIKLEKFHRLLDRYGDKKTIIPVSCKGLMEFVEQGDLDGETMDRYLKKHLEPFINERTETIVLGCTHYPFLRPHIRQFLGSRDIDIIDGSLGTSLEIKRRLDEKGLLRTEPGERNVVIKNSTGKQEMIDLSIRLLNMPLGE